MDVHSDYEDLFKILNSHRIKYLVVGAYATMYYTQPRYTKDIVSLSGIDKGTVWTRLGALFSLKPECRLDEGSDGQ